MRIRKLLLFGIIMPALLAAPAMGEQDIAYTGGSPEALAQLQAGIEQFRDFRMMEAEASFAKAIKADSQMAIAYYYLAQTAGNQEDYLKRLAMAEKFMSKASEPERLLIRISRDDFNGDAAKVDADYQELLKLAPNSKTAHFNYATYLNNQQRFDDSEAQFLKTIKIAPDFARAYNDYSYLLARLGRDSEAIENLQKYVSLKPKEANPHDSMGEIYLYSGKYDKSMDEYNKALALDNNFIFSLVGLGHNYTFMGQYDRARDMYNEIQKRARSKDDTITALFWIGTSYAYQKNFDKAIEIFQSQSDFAKSHGDIYNETNAYDNIIQTCREKGDFAGATEALAMFRKLASRPQIDPQIAKAFNRLALAREIELLAMQNKLPEARTKLTEYMADIKGQNDPALLRTYHDLAGRIAFYAGDYTTAISELTQSDPLNSYARYYLGLAYEKSGKGMDAQNTFTEVAALNRNGLGYAFVRQAASER